MTKSDIKKLTLLFVVWRIGLFVVGYFANKILPYEPSFPYASVIAADYGLPQWLFSWANFDGVHYLTIVQKGYIGTGLIQAFFPFYPLVTKFSSFIIHNPLIAGLIVSNAFFYAFMSLWLKFIGELIDKKTAWLSLLLILLFPTSFFFVSLYGESMFMFFVTASFYALYKKKYALTGLMIALASATRLVGIFLVPALIFQILTEECQSSNVKCQIKSKIKMSKEFIKSLKHLVIHLAFEIWHWELVKKILFISIGSLGLVSYMFYLWQTFGDPLYFYHVQEEFGGGRSESLIFYPQVIWRYLKIFITYKPFGLKYYAFIQEFITSTVGFLLILLAWPTKNSLSTIHNSELSKSNPIIISSITFSAMAFTLPTLTGTFSSMPRYILVCFPIYIVVASLIKDKKWLQIMYFSISTLLLIFNTVLFIQGYWVS